MKMVTKKIPLLVLSLVCFSSQMTWADSRAGTGTGVVNNYQTYTPTTEQTAVTTTTAYKYEGPTIRQAAENAMANTKKGSGFASAVTIITAAGVIATCPTAPGNPKCIAFAAGLAGSLIASKNMNKATDASQNTYDAVRATSDVKDLNGTPMLDETPDPGQSKLEKSPEWPKVLAAKKVLENGGWKVDLKKPSMTAPNGQNVSASIASSPAAMAAAGIPASDIQAFQNALKKAAEMAGLKDKSADGAASDMFGDVGGGGGGSRSPASATPNFNLPGTPRQKLGINRDPSQVAGMKKDYNGSPIGVAGDSLFEMLDRRYQMHNQNGSFISP